MLSFYNCKIGLPFWVGWGWCCRWRWCWRRYCCGSIFCYFRYAPFSYHHLIIPTWTPVVQGYAECNLGNISVGGFCTIVIGTMTSVSAVIHVPFIGDFINQGKCQNGAVTQSSFGNKQLARAVFHNES